MRLYENFTKWLWLMMLAFGVLAILWLPSILYTWRTGALPTWAVVVAVLSAPIVATFVCFITLLELYWERKFSYLRFSSRSNMDAFLSNNLDKRRNARMSIDVANFTQYLPHSRQGGQYMQKIKKCVQENRKITLRRLLTFPTVEKVMWANEWANDLASCSNFEMRYLKDSCAEEKLAMFMPTFYIMDSTLLCVGFFDESKVSLNTLIKNPDLAADFQAYFDILWRNASKIKDKASLGEIPRRHLFQGILKEFVKKGVITEQDFERLIERL